jgi:hypothetical protein
MPAPGALGAVHARCSPALFFSFSSYTFEPFTLSTSQAQTGVGEDVGSRAVSLMLLQENLINERIYEQAYQWTAERLKSSDQCWGLMIGNDLLVVIRFLNYVWAHKDEDEEECKDPASGTTPGQDSGKVTMDI